MVCSNPSGEFWQGSESLSYFPVTFPSRPPAWTPVKGIFIPTYILLKSRQTKPLPIPGQIGSKLLGARGSKY